MSSETPIEKAVSEFWATERCYENTPYGKSYAVSQLGRDSADYPMPLFTRENQASLAVHIEEARRECDKKNECWDEAEHIEVEERWLHRWKDPAVHARVIAEMDTKDEKPPVEWRRPSGQV